MPAIGSRGEPNSQQEKTPPRGSGERGRGRPDRGGQAAQDGVTRGGRLQILQDKQGLVTQQDRALKARRNFAFGGWDGDRMNKHPDLELEL